MVEQNAFLQWRQRIDVLHVGRPAWHGRRDAVDIGLRQGHQRQHVRGNGRRIGRNTVRRDHDLPGIAADCGSQPGQRRCGEQGLHVGVQSGLAHARDQGHCQQRMPAQFEEVIIATYLIDLEQLDPDGGQSLFGLALRRLILTCAISIALRRRQRLAVQLAVGGQRQRLQVHEGDRHHVLGQCLGQVRAQTVHGQFGVTRVVGHQALVAGTVFAGQHRRFPDLRMFGQPGLDLAQFDTEAAHLDLEVVAAEEFDAAVFPPAAQVAGLVQPGFGFIAERILDKAFGGQLGPVQIASRQSGAAHIQFAHDADRNGLELRVQQVDTGVGDGLADRRQAFFSGRHRAGGRNHAVLGGAVVIDQFERQSGRRITVQPVAAGQQTAQGQMLGPGRRQHQFRQWRRHERHSDAVVGQLLP